jgi:2',3'-cyclic-nucleotide 2'-phosphodiesterase/3'-nucleotidase
MALALILWVLPVYGQELELTILATSDVHNNYLDYDYFTDMPTEQTGLVRIATAIKELRNESPNVLLFDDGDNIQGNPFGEYLAKNPPQEGQISPIMTLLNALQYDAISLGNHEFNFGLPYLNTVIAGAKFPVLSANVINPLTRTPYFRPYTILTRSFRDKRGTPQLVRVGVLGLLPPQIITWDGALLHGKVQTLDGFTTAQRYVPEMKAAGADIIVILAHSGIQDYPLKGGEENFSYFLTTIPDVDVVISGHAHEKFPGRAYAKVREANIELGTINGVPVVMPGSFADTLGVINLRLRKDESGWKRSGGTAQLLPVYDSAARRSNLASVQIINEAQIRYAEQALAGTAYAQLPILSVAAPFKAGGRQGPRYYTNVPAGPLAIKNIADLYVYPNTVIILKLTGKGIKEWLERSAGQFNQLESANQEEQYIQNDDFPTYLFEVIDGVSYRIDPSRPTRYNPDGSLRDEKAERVLDLQFQGRPIREDAEFALVTNNYRAYGGGNFPGGNPGNIILETPDESRQVILKYYR